VTASYKINNDWGSGYCANLTVTNGGSTPTTWTAALNVAGSVTQMWNGTYTQSGSILTVKGLGWNGTLQPKASDSSIGFCATR
jgi:cellulase/cellobiase CelA1